MDLTGYLIVIGILVIAVIYLQLRLTFSPRQTVVMIPQPTSEGPGCGVAALVILIIATFVLAAIFGLLPIG